jgi:hypothetical protein
VISSLIELFSLETCVTSLILRGKISGKSHFNRRHLFGHIRAKVLLPQVQHREFRSNYVLCVFPMFLFLSPLVLIYRFSKVFGRVLCRGNRVSDRQVSLQDRLLGNGR